MDYYILSLHGSLHTFFTWFIKYFPYMVRYKLSLHGSYIVHYILSLHGSLHTFFTWFIHGSLHTFFTWYIVYLLNMVHYLLSLPGSLYTFFIVDSSGSVVECLTCERGAAGSSLTGLTALWSFSKTHLS